MPRVIDDIPLDLPTGLTQLGPTGVPNNVQDVVIRIARNTTATPTLWPNTSTKLTGAIAFSFDQGATFTPVAGWSAEGGIALNKQGNEIAETVIQFSIARAPQRQVQVDLTVENGPLNTVVTIEVN
jgi:hypothetical protein